MPSFSKGYQFRYGELFAGPGGLSWGALHAEGPEKLNWKISHAWANDLDSDACATYRRNNCPNDPASVYNEDVGRFMRRVKTDPEEYAIDFLGFGFPCNDFSMVGERKGLAGRFGGLYRSGIKALDLLSPMAFVAENVSGLRNIKGGKTLPYIFERMRLAGLGYKVTAHLYKMEEYGIPQTRHRIFFVGLREDTGLEFKVPAPTHMDRYETVEKALRSIPVSVSNQELTRQAPHIVARLQHTKPGQNAWNADLPEELQLRVGGARLSQIYKRLDSQKPSYTVTGSGGGGTHIYHWDEPRALTNRERARIQTFDDQFVFEGTKERVRRQIGMAVPPRFSRMLFGCLLQLFAGKSYSAVQPNLGLGKSEGII